MIVCPNHYLNDYFLAFRLSFDQLFGNSFELIIANVLLSIIIQTENCFDSQNELIILINQK